MSRVNCCHAWLEQLGLQNLRHYDDTCTPNVPSWAAIPVHISLTFAKLFQLRTFPVTANRRRGRTQRQKIGGLYLREQRLAPIDSTAIACRGPTVAACT